MRFERFFYPLAALITFAGLATAADQASPTQAQAGVTNDAVTQQDPNFPTRSFSDRAEDSGLKSETSEPLSSQQIGRFHFHAPHLRAAGSDLCYTMRTYMVKPSERLVDNESGLQGYSSCQLASGYRVRSADIPEQTGGKLK